MNVALITTEKVNDFCRQLKDAGCKVVRDKEAGTVDVTWEKQDVFRAIHKGPGQPWIASFHQNDRVQWIEGKTCDRST